MPDVAVHASFGKEVFSSLPDQVQQVILPEPYTFALFGPDAWFMYKPWIRRQGRGRRMHTTLTGAFLLALLRKAREGSCRAEMFSYLAGFFCHYALDSTAHPYIIYVTTEEYSFPHSHMSMEHALDAAEMQRDGFWGQPHPITDHYFPALQLPKTMQKDLDEVFEEIYGWKNGWKDLNRSCRRFRSLYRILEHPSGIAAHLARITRSASLRSFIYSESHFLTLDPENSEHRTWRHSHDPSLSYTDSFPELREKARRRALTLIEETYRYVWQEEGTEDELTALIGNNSYLSGLSADDPRNHSVKSLLPST